MRGHIPPCRTQPLQDQHPRSGFKPKAMKPLRCGGGGKQPPTSSHPAFHGQKWHKSPVPSPQPCGPEELRQLFCSGESYGSFYNQSATPSRLFFSFKGSS